MCQFCLDITFENKTKEETAREKKVADLFGAAYIAALATDIYNGIVHVYNLPLYLYEQTGLLLNDGMLASGATEELAKALSKNIYKFSAAKTYHQIKQANALLRVDGQLRPYKEFKKEFEKLFTKFNDDYLLAEYNTAIVAGESAVKWQKAVSQKSEFPFLRYITRRDNRVRPTHAELDNITRPIDDIFWDSYMPPNGWNCRCTTSQENVATITDLTGFKKPKDVPDLFMYNPGKQQKIYPDAHPYFQVPAKDVNLAANNFGLPIPKNIA